MCNVRWSPCLRNTALFRQVRTGPSVELCALREAALTDAVFVMGDAPVGSDEDVFGPSPTSLKLAPQERKRQKRNKADSRTGLCPSPLPIHSPVLPDYPPVLKGHTTVLSCSASCRTLLRLQWTSSRSLPRPSSPRTKSSSAFTGRYSTKPRCVSVWYSEVSDWVAEVEMADPESQ